METPSSSNYSATHFKKYKILKIVGEGSFGHVFKCVHRETEEIVAIKEKWWALDNEACTLKILMEKKLDKCNIVKFYDGFSGDRCLVFEHLDITLGGFLAETKTAMRLQDVRRIIQQMAVAFDALKNIGLIHTDVHINNIMLVDRVRPVRVKLIGFDMAIPSHKAKRSMIDHGSFYRAPEIMLGMPFSEAIDMWSLGCVMAEMVVGSTLFPGRSDHETLRYIIDILGPPPDRIIKEGRKSREYFQSDSQGWRLTEFSRWCGTDDRSYSFRSLDGIKVGH
ncbi:homeodomain-interacting protein kinase 3-like isoform X2 [Thunnus thynnus]